MSYFRVSFLALSLVGLVASCGDDDRPMTGACDPACTIGLLCCTSSCVNINDNPNHCGGCGISCGGGTCVGGTCMGGTDGGGIDAPGTDTGPSMCTPSCSASQRCCGSSCVNQTGPMGVLEARSDSSFMHCNGCGLSCDPDRASRCGTQPGGGGPPQCLCGNNIQCAPGQGCVANESGVFICADFNFDRNNCGGVGIRCAEGESCSSGNCVCAGAGMRCGDGQSCCGGACIDTTSDTMNCGGCGNVCGANAPNCNSGSCGCGAGPACREPMAGMFGGGGDTGQSCCGGSCVENTTSSCLCSPCTGEDTCQVAGDLFGMGGGEAQVCCGGDEVAFFGCGGGGFGDAGFPFP